MLQCPERKPFNAFGSVKVSLNYKDRYTDQQVYVIIGLNHNLLGLLVIEALQLVAMLHSVRDETALIREKFPLLFNAWVQFLFNFYRTHNLIKARGKAICTVNCMKCTSSL